MGGRGCPRCGSHDTERVSRGGVQWCHSCDARWFPCRPGCRGYDIKIEPGSDPRIEGCTGCGVPDSIARQWPEAWRAVAYRLDTKKLEAVTE